MNIKLNHLKRLSGAIVFGAALLIGMNGMTYAQDHHQRHEQRELREHQRRERYYYGNSRELREHQRRERYRLENHERNERRGYYNDGFYNRRDRRYYDRRDRSYHW